MQRDTDDTRDMLAQDFPPRHLPGIAFEVHNAYKMT